MDTDTREQTIARQKLEADAYEARTAAESEVKAIMRRERLTLRHPGEGGEQRRG